MVAAATGITDDDRHELIKSGSPVFNNRVHWALTYMSQAGLVNRPKRGVVQITDRGLAALATHPHRIDNNVLLQFEEFKVFKSRVHNAATPTTEPSKTGNSEPLFEQPVQQTHVDSATPLEIITGAVEEINTEVASRVIDRVREQPPIFLERLVLELLAAMGYGGAGSTERLGRSGDEGLDGVIRQDALGLDRIYVQAKRYAAENAVGRPDIQGFVGALHGAQADRGVFITTSRFSREAYDYAEKVAARVILIDGTALARLLVRHNIGVQDDKAYVVKKIDEDYFEGSPE